jgi:hypothetical protein
MNGIEHTHTLLIWEACPRKEQDCKTRLNIVAWFVSAEQPNCYLSVPDRNLKTKWTVSAD